MSYHDANFSATLPPDRIKKFLIVVNYEISLAWILDRRTFEATET